MLLAVESQWRLSFFFFLLYSAETAAHKCLAFSVDVPLLTICSKKKLYKNSWAPICENNDRIAISFFFLLALPTPVSPDRYGCGLSAVRRHFILVKVRPWLERYDTLVGHFDSTWWDCLLLACVALIASVKGILSNWEALPCLHLEAEEEAWLKLWIIIVLNEISRVDHETSWV